LKYLLYIITSGQVIALFSLGNLDSGIFYYGFILGNGISSGLYSVLMAVTWPRFYGRDHLGKISGLVMAIIVFASALGPIIFSFSFTKLGGYKPGIYIIMAISIILFVLSLKANNPQRKYRIK
jgi:MFS family permease